MINIIGYDPIQISKGFILNDFYCDKDSLSFLFDPTSDSVSIYHNEEKKEIVKELDWRNNNCNNNQLLTKAALLSFIETYCFNEKPDTLFNPTIVVGNGGTGFVNVVLESSDFPLTVETGKMYLLENGVLSGDSTVNVSGLTNENDEFWFLNRDHSYVLSFTGQQVYYADEREVDSILWQSNILIRNVNAKLRVIQG